MAVIAPQSGSGQADPGQHLIIKIDIQCGLESVEFVAHTKGLTLSVNV
jgi:hypothetical protein